MYGSGSFGSGISFAPFGNDRDHGPACGLPACAESGRAANVEMRLAWAADEDRHAETNFAELNRSTAPIRQPLARAAPLRLRREPEMNNTVIIGLFAFAAILAGAFAGVEARDRLPKHHLIGGSQQPR
jgi:hypothetical protein